MGRKPILKTFSMALHVVRCSSSAAISWPRSCLSEVMPTSAMPHGLIQLKGSSPLLALLVPFVSDVGAYLDFAGRGARVPATAGDPIGR